METSPTSSPVPPTYRLSNSLSARLVLTTIISSLVLALILSLLGGLLGMSYLADRIGEVFEDKARSAINRFDYEVGIGIDEIVAVADSGYLSDNDIAIEDKRILLDAIAASHEYYAWVGYVGVDGVVIAANDALLEGVDVSTRPWFIGGLMGAYVGDLHEAVLLERLLDAPEGERLRFLDVAAPVYDSSGEIVGVLGAHIDWSWVSATLSAINLNSFSSPSPAGQTEMLVINSEGYVVLQSGFSVPPNVSEPYAIPTPEMMAKTSDLSGHGLTVDEDENHYVAGFARSTGYLDFPGLSYTVIVRQNRDQALAPAAQFQLSLLAVGLVLAGGFTLVNFGVIRLMLRPLRRIVGAIMQMRAGIGNVAIPTYDSSDEVGILSRALNDSMVALSQRNVDLTTLNESLEKRIDERTAVVERRARELANEIATRKQLEVALTESRESFRRLAETSLDGIAVSVDGVIIYSNRALIALFGYEQYELVRMSETEFVAPESRHIVQDIFSLGDQRLHEVTGIRKNGERFPLEISGRTVRYTGVMAHVMTMRDISARKRTEAEIQTLYMLSQKRLEDVQKLNETLEYRSNHDHLTNLTNRQHFEQRLQTFLNEAPLRGRGVAVMFIDLDRFKEVNDLMGHSVGDLLLQMAANRMRSAIEDTGLLARMGGDEFALAIPMIQRRAEAFTIAETIISAVGGTSYNLRGRELTITTSIGISFYPEHGHTVENLLRKADIALYSAKAKGRNTYRQADETAEIDLMAQMQMGFDLRQALERGELALHYQPQYTLRDDRVVAFEALLRWNHPMLGSVPPSRFIPVAEASDLIIPIGEWVIREACRQVKVWHDLGHSIGMAVNVSPRQFENTDFVASVMSAIEEAGILPSTIELEVTEGLLMRDIEAKADILERLSNDGVRVAIDDFGTGFSSMSYLQKLPISTLKIDRSFIADIRDDAPDAKATATAIIRAVSQMAHSLGLTVVAEGVETDLQLSVLRLLETDALQGYLLGRPMPPEGALELLERGSRP